MNELPNCLGLDIGTRRIGVATHPSGMTQAMPFETVDARETPRAVARIVAICQERDISVIVVGWPMDMDGVARGATRMVDAFMTPLQKALDTHGHAVEVVRWDERLTTSSAQSLLIGADVSRARRKQVVDKIAAAHILEGYLRSRSPF
jgi:putative Holliday junction resolvase